VIKKPASYLKRNHEKRGHGSHGVPVCGVDEVGRGPLAGPVVAAAVILPERLPKSLSRIIDDSKRLSAEKREEIAAELHAIAMVSIALASVEEIDAINILRASLLAMQRAVEALPVAPLLALVDGNQKPPLSLPVQTIIGGDGLELSIAAASIVAKVYRDRLMQDLHEAHPQYGWASNAGYSTRHHCEALRQHGCTPHHRTSFAPVRAVLETMYAA
jgi:ribonuclease HII